MDCGASPTSRKSFVLATDAVRRLGTPEKTILTFYKEHLAAATHQDADLISRTSFVCGDRRTDAQLNEQIRTGQPYFFDADAQALPPLLLGKMVKQGKVGVCCCSMRDCRNSWRTRTGIAGLSK